MRETTTPVYKGKSLGSFYVGGWKLGQYHETILCRSFTSTRYYKVVIFDHDGIHRRPFMREQDIGDQTGRQMIDDGKAMKPCATCIGKTPEIIHLEPEADQAIPCEGSEEWVQMEGQKAANNPDLFRPQQVDCFKCPIRVECFSKAMRERPDYGIWGGTTPAQRKAWGDRADEIVIRRLRNGQEVKPYGGPGKKPSAYQPSLAGIG